jgi:hypothetical protein
MMQEFRIEPHVGIGPILLGAARDDVRAALFSLSFPLRISRGRSDYFCDSSIQVEFGDDDRADFIGCSCCLHYTLTYRGTNVFDVPAEELFALIADNDGSGPHSFNPAEYRFPKQILTLWEADCQYDRLGSEQRSVWGQVGLGNQRYLDDVLRIEGRST